MDVVEVLPSVRSSPERFVWMNADIASMLAFQVSSGIRKLKRILRLYQPGMTKTVELQQGHAGRSY